jgi:hypothetical protein
MRIAYTNYVDARPATSLTALTENPSFPAINMQEQRLSKVYRSTAITSQTVIIDLGSAQGITTAAILGHNLSTSATITLDANTTNSWGSPATSKTLIWNADAILLFFNSVSYRWWKFTINDTANSNGYLSIGRLWLGTYITISPSSLEDFNVIKKRSDNVIHGRGRQKFASIGVDWRRFELTFPRTDYAMIQQLEAMFDAVGKHTSIIFCNFDDLRTYPLVDPCYCSIDSDLNFKHETRMKFSYSLSLEEEK